MNKQDFLLKLKDPETYDLIIEGIRRTQQYYSSVIQEAAWFEIPRKNKGLRTWRIIFEVGFKGQLPSLNIEGNIAHHFKQGKTQVHVTLTRFNNNSKNIIVFVSLYDE